MAFKLIDSVKLNQNYRGHAERCIYTFTVAQPDQLGANWTANKILEAHIDELRTQGAILLEYKLYQDAAPTFTTDYKVDMITSASPLFWNLIIIGVLAVLSIIFVKYTIQDVKDIAQYAPQALAIGAGAALLIGAAALVYVVKRR